MQDDTPLLVAVDTETTGINPEAANPAICQGMVQIAMRVYLDGVYREGVGFSCYLQPLGMDGKWIASQPKAQEVHGLSDAFLQASGVPYAMVADAVEERWRGRGDAYYRLLHNAPFDMAFINQEREWLGQEALAWENVICTLLFAASVLPSGQRLNLDALCEYFSINRAGRDEGHDAGGDADLAVQVFYALREKFPEAPFTAKDIWREWGARIPGIRDVTLEEMEVHLTFERGRKSEAQPFVDLLEKEEKKRGKIIVLEKSEDRLVLSANTVWANFPAIRRAIEAWEEARAQNQGRATA